MSSSPDNAPPTYEELRQALAEEESANRELAVLAYSAAHDLRAPVRSIAGFSQILLDRHADLLNDEGKDCLRRMQAAGRDMSRMIDALLKLVSLTRGEVRRADVDLSAAALSIVAALRLGEPGRQAEFVVQPGLKAAADPDLLNELLEILLDNAWKFSSRRPRARIEVGSALRGGRAMFFVRDDGAGFDPLYAGKLFVPFQRLHGANEFPGIGAGLAVAARIARLHGGRVEAEGEVGKGATFYFTLGPASPEREY